jgi:hypothetical protein
MSWTGGLRLTLLVGLVAFWGSSAHAAPVTLEPDLFTYEFKGADFIGWLTIEHQLIEFKKGGRHEDYVELREALTTPIPGGDPSQSWWFEGTFTDAFPVTNSFKVVFKNGNTFEQAQNAVEFFGAWGGIDFFNMQGLELITVLDSDRWGLQEGTYASYESSRVKSVKLVPEPNVALLALVGFGAVAFKRLRPHQRRSHLR